MNSLAPASSGAALPSCLCPGHSHPGTQLHPAGQSSRKNRKLVLILAVKPPITTLPQFPQRKNQDQNACGGKRAGDEVETKVAGSKSLGGLLKEMLSLIKDLFSESKRSHPSPEPSLSAPILWDEEHAGCAGQACSKEEELPRPPSPWLQWLQTPSENG